MQINQAQWIDNTWLGAQDANGSAQLILLFGTFELLMSEQGKAAVAALSVQFPGAIISGAQTGHAIIGQELDTAILSAQIIHFDTVRLEKSTVNIAAANESEACGEALAKDLLRDDLKMVVVFSDGSVVDGAALTQALSRNLPGHVHIAGGLAGDGSRFETTSVVGRNGAKQNTIMAIGFYGDALHIGAGYRGGWRPFGPVRQITKAQANVVHEIDNTAALDLYKKYLGEEAKALPASALLYPLKLWSPDNPENFVVRTILDVDHDAGSMTLAGNVPEGWMGQLMVGTHDGLVQGAFEAGQSARQKLNGAGEGKQQSLALLVSCVGRQMLMGQRAGEELEAVARSMPDQCTVAGFYSYGEINCSGGGQEHGFKNQTMTVTVISEL